MIAALTVVLALLLIWFSFRSISQPGFALAMMWSMYATEQLLQQGHPIFVRVSSLLNVGFTFVAIVGILNGIRIGTYRGWRIPTEAVLCGGLFAFAALSFFWSVSPSHTSKWLITQMPYLVAFMLIAPLCATDQRQLQLAVNTTVFLGGVVMLGHAISTYQGSRYIVFAAQGEEYGGNPLAVASYAGYVGICALFSVYGRKFSPLVALKVGILLLAAFVIIKSHTRGQLVALVLVSFIWLPVIARATLKRSTIIALAGSAVIACGSIYVFNNMLRDTGRWRADRLEVASEGRFEMATDLMSAWGDGGPFTWLAGTGSSSSFKICGFYPHNVPLEVLGEEGLIGFALLAAFCITVLRRSSRMMFSKELPTETRVNLGILVAIFCFESMLSLKQSSLLGSCGWFGMGITIAWIASRLEVKAKRSVRKRRFANQVFSGMRMPPQMER